MQSQVKKTTHHFCSRGCMGKWRTKNWVGVNNPNYMGKAITRICKQCGEKFKIWRTELDRGRGTFCSKGCQGEWQRKYWRGKNHPSYRGGPLTRYCKYCGEGFQVIPFEANRGRGKFCSKECHYNWRVKTGAMLGEKGPNWRGGRAKNHYGGQWDLQRMRALKRDRYQCQICGRKNDLIVHHKEPVKKLDDWHEVNRLENLVTLCRSCHTRLEAGHLKFPALTSPSHVA